MVSAQIPGDALTQACGAESNVVCRLMFEATGSGSVAQLVEALAGLSLRLGLILLLTYAAVRVARSFIDRAVRRFDDSQARTGQRVETIGGLLQNVATVAIAAVAGVMLLGELGISVGPLLAGLGVVGLPVAFGTQGMVTDVVSGLSLLVENQFGPGDVVDIDGDVGVVERLTLRTTRIRDINGHLHDLRNGNIERVTNMSREWARVIVDVDVAYDTDLDRAFAVLQRVGDEVADDEDFAAAVEDAPQVWGVQRLGPEGITLRLVAGAIADEQWALGRELRKRIKAALDAEGIEMPAAQRPVWLRTDITGTRQRSGVQAASRDGG